MVNDMYKKRQPLLLYRVMNVIMMGYAFIMLIRRMKQVIRNGQSFFSWDVTEFMINYQGGYVRRGFLGEILYKINECFPAFDPRWAIFCVSLFCFFVFICFILRKFKENDFCWWILPLNICVSGAFSIVRKDYLCMLLVLFVLYSFNKIKIVGWRYLLLSVLLILSLNLHECVFFIIGGFMLLAMYRDSDSKFGWRLWGIFSLIVTMGLVCMSKGNEVARQIWNSWGAFHSEFVDTHPATSINAIGWNCVDTFQFHIRENFLISLYGVRLWFSKPLIWCFILFVLPNIIFIRRGWQANRQSMEVKRMLSIMLFQFASLLPMFTVLSCDGSRICFYWTISSMLIYFYMPADKCMQIIPSIVQRIAAKIQKIVIFRNSVAWSLIVMLFLSITTAGTNLYSFFSNSVVGVYFLIFYQGCMYLFA